MKLERRGFRLDVCIKLGSFLLEGTLLDKVQCLLCKHAPKWTSMMHVYRYREQATPIDAFLPGALTDAVRSRGLERGPLSKELQRRFPTPPRLLGSAEIRGAHNSLIVIPSFDEKIVARRGDSWGWGNTITFQACKPSIDGVHAVIWARRLFADVCDALSPWYGNAHMGAEFDSKNISHEGGGTRAIGIDVSKYLPGMYWLNFFGKPYRDLIGRDRLLSAPAYEVVEIDDGILLAIDADALAWKSEEYQDKERAVLAHLGAEHFFSRDDPGREYVAPDFLPLC